MTFRLVTAAITGLAPSVAAAAPATAEPVADYTRAQFQADLDHLHELGVTGVQGRVVLADGTVWSASSGVADKRTGRPVPANGHYRIAGNTKTFVATVVLQLVAEGALRLDDSVEEHLPGLVPGGSEITLRDLLQHTSGLPDYHPALPGNTAADFDRHRFDHYEPEELVARATALPPEFPPGTAFAYSNTGYVLAGMIVEAATGNSWREEVERRIIEPLGLRHTEAPEDDPFLPRPHAHAYQQWALGEPGMDTTTFNPSRSDAAGAMVSTTADLGKFFRALLAGHLLPPELMTEMRTTVEVDEGDDVQLGYGLGLYEKRLTCGGSYWDQGGNTAGVISRGGVSGDGDVSVALVFTGAEPRSVEDLMAMQRVSEGVGDRVFCG